MSLRKPIAAGNYYSDSPNVLKNQLDVFFSKAVPDFDQGLKILIVPHAGFAYSGQVAAHGFAKIDKNIKKIIILGVSHASYFDGMAIWAGGDWQTPLGIVPTDQVLAGKLVNNKDIFFDTKVFLSEPTQEVQLPFLQYKLKSFQIVPVLIGQSNPDTLQKLAVEISQNLDHQTLLVISSDLSHYPNQSQARLLDKEIIQAISEKNLIKFTKLLSQDLDTQVQTRACGGQAIKAALHVSQIKKYEKTKLFSYQNSGEITGDSKAVVGYVSLGFYQNKLLSIARESLASFLKNGQ